MTSMFILESKGDYFIPTGYYMTDLKNSFTDQWSIYGKASQQNESLYGHFTDPAMQCRPFASLWTHNAIYRNLRFGEPDVEAYKRYTMAADTLPKAN